MNKKETFESYVSERYNGVEEIISNDEYTEKDVLDFLRLRDSSKLHNTLEDWKRFRGIADKIHRCGINSVLMREDVNGTSTGAEQDNRGHIIKYIVVDTKYGKIWVREDGRTIAYKV